MTSVSFFFPCYNEDSTVAKLIEKTDSFAREYFDDYEILIINDGSSDKTKEIAERYQSQNPRVRLVNHLQNMGYGAALKTGFREAKKDYIFYTDGDMQFDVKELKPHLNKINSDTVLSGYRAQRRDTATRKLSAKIFNLVVLTFFGLNVRDIDCAFKVYPKEIVDKMDLKSEGAMIDAEMLVKSKHLGKKIEQFSHFPYLFYVKRYSFLGFDSILNIHFCKIHFI